MSTYPAYDILMSSSHSLEQGHTDDFSRSGIQHSRLYHALQYHRFKLVHKLLPAEFDALLDFYEAEPREDHDLDYHSVGYTVKFLQPPQIVLNREDRRYLVEVEMRGTLTGSV